MSFSDFSTVPCFTSAEYSQPIAAGLVYNGYARKPCDQVILEIDNTLESSWFQQVQIKKGAETVQYGNLSSLAYVQFLECAMKSRNPAEFQQCERILGPIYPSIADRKEAIDTCSRDFQSPCVAPEFSILKKVTGTYEKQQSAFANCQKTDPQELKMHACKQAALERPYKVDTFTCACDE